MKEYPIRIMNMKDLIQFQASVFSWHLRGEIRQMDYVCNICFGLGLALALPLDAATLCLKDCSKAHETDILRVCHTTM